MVLECITLNFKVSLTYRQREQIISYIKNVVLEGVNSDIDCITFINDTTVEIYTNWDNVSLNAVMSSIKSFFNETIKPQLNLKGKVIKEYTDEAHSILNDLVSREFIILEDKNE